MIRQEGNVLSRTDTVESTDLAVVVALKGSASSALPVAPAASATSEVTRVPANAANVTLKAANANRRGLAVQNSATSNLYLKLGATADLTAGAESYTVKVVPGAYYEVPFGYTGIVDGIWDAADATGEALVTEVTA